MCMNMYIYIYMCVSIQCMYVIIYVYTRGYPPNALRKALAQQAGHDWGDGSLASAFTKNG